ncbi:hypothetical protein [Desulforamulus aquiferis]|uniref:Uncharacterized protein n=1 Tax=Desulforamulus aquiferis TaxID=1397668 RepID=A0AAW7Z9T7_9FIRM|nr:hypothetical protein [Desulforamulus aquiferis]MDO7786117.1 hypothetical protein [Desulforamulus aquiferis]
MGHFINFDPNRFNQEAAGELRPEANKDNRPDLLSPEEWTDCETEKELANFSIRNKAIKTQKK